MRICFVLARPELCGGVKVVSQFAGLLQDAGGEELDRVTVQWPGKGEAEHG